MHLKNLKIRQQIKQKEENNMIGFGKFGKWNLGINSLSDIRLKEIDPTKTGFYDRVLKYRTTDRRVQDFIKAVSEVKAAKLQPFYRPVMDPSMEGDEVVFKKGNKPAVGHSFNFWRQKAKEMPSVEGKKWHIGSEYQYYAFLTWLINRMVETGWDTKKAIEAVVLDSEKLGCYFNSEGALGYFESTGNREVCGIFDLANTSKLLACSNEKAGGFWFAGGDYVDCSNVFPLADLNHRNIVDDDYLYSVGWLVLA